jgi:hypothetical protein
LIEKGAIAAVPGQKRIARKVGEVNGVPVLDLELRRADGSAVVMRIVMFRTFALSASVLVPKGATLDEARAITASVTPPKPG